MWIFDRYSPYSYQNNREKYIDDDEKREFTLKECLWFCMTSLTPQGGGELNVSKPPKLTSIINFLFFLLSIIITIGEAPKNLSGKFFYAFIC